MHTYIIILVIFVSYIQAEVGEKTEISAIKEELTDDEAHQVQEEVKSGLEDQEDKTNTTTSKDVTESKEEESGEEEEDLYMNDESDEYDAHGEEGHNSDDDDVKSFEHRMIQKPLSVIIRCSRRFTPGICMAPVVSVWTYMFDQQNCTERFGCHLSEYANRFHNYNRCNRMCMALSNVYSKVLDMEKNHKNAGKREYGLPRRFGGIQLNDNKDDLSDLPPLSATASESDSRPLARQYYDYVERQKSLSYDDYSSPAGVDDLVPPDIDEFRVQQEVWDDFYHNFN